MAGNGEPKRGGKRTASGRSGGDQAPEPGKTSLGIGVVPLSGGGIFKSAAVAVLKQERKLMTTGDITRVALERGLINCQGKTPEATMASALYTDVKRKHNKSVFTRPQEGLFGLREWIAEGFYPEGWSGPADSEGVAPYKRRGAGTSGSRGRSGLGRASKRRAAAVWRRAGSDTGDSEDEGGEGEEVPEGDELLEEGQPQDSSQMEVDDAPYSSGGRRRRTAAVENVYVNGSASRRQSRDGVGRGTASNGGAYIQGIPNLGNLAKDELDLESPLHVLGDVALSTRDQEELEAEQAPSSAQRGGGTKRERERPAALQLPENPMAHSAPKSPYEDSLAALHEIATGGSPHGFVRESSTDGRKRPRLHVDVEGMPGQAHMQQHSAGDFFPGMHLASPLLTTARGRRGGPQQFIHPLPSPVGAMDGAALGIPDLLPGVAGDQQGGLLFSPTLMQHIHNGNTPRIGGTSADGTGDHKNPFKPDGFGAHQHIAPYHAGLHAYGPQPTQLTPEERYADAEGLQQVVQRLEARLGPTNPITAKAWLALARMFHSLSKPLGPPAATKAMAALQHAAQLASEAATALGCPWLGAHHVETLVKSLNAAAPMLGGVATPGHPLGGTPKHLCKASTTVLPSGPGATTLSLGPPSALLPPSTASALASTAAAGTSLITPLCLGTPPVQGPTMQVIPAGQFNPEKVPNIAVLNLGSRDDEAAAKPTSSGITKLILQPPAVTLQLGSQTPALQLGAPSLPSTQQPLQLSLGSAAQTSPMQQPASVGVLHSTPLKTASAAVVPNLTPLLASEGVQAAGSPVPLQLGTAAPAAAAALQQTPTLMPRLQLGVAEGAESGSAQGGDGVETAGAGSQHTVDLMQPAAPVLAHA